MFQFSILEREQSGYPGKSHTKPTKLTLSNRAQTSPPMEPTVKGKVASPNHERWCCNLPPRVWHRALCAEQVYGLSFGIYITGALIVLAGLIYGAVLLHVPGHWVVVGGIVFTGMGILMGVNATRQKDPS
jgi:hypothetical protein